MYWFNEFYIPERMMPGIRRYVESGIVPGDFLCAVIQNDLSEAVGRADDENLKNLPAYVAYFYNEVPSNCWGSKERMQEWANAHVSRQSENEDEEGKGGTGDGRG